MASAWACWSRACRVAAVRDDSSPRLFSASAWHSRLPTSRLSVQGLLVAGGGGRVVPGQLLHQAEFVEGVGLAAEVARSRNRLRACRLLAAAAG